MSDKRARVSGEVVRVLLEHERQAWRDRSSPPRTSLGDSTSTEIPAEYAAEARARREEASGWLRQAVAAFFDPERPS